MLFELGKYTLDIDVDKTKDFYLHANRITEHCNCPGCRNYEKWAGSLYTEPKTTLVSMGVLPEKAPEVYVEFANGDGSLLYGGFYHLCGKIIQGDDPWVEVSEGHRIFNESACVDLTGGFRVVFSERVALLEDGFPMPVIQMEILAEIPWVLPEKCDY